MLGVSTDNSEEFKANIKIKTIRSRGKIILLKENMSFHNISICNYVNQNFENSKRIQFFESNSFPIVVFKGEE